MHACLQLMPHECECELRACLLYTPIPGGLLCIQLVGRRDMHASRSVSWLELIGTYMHVWSSLVLWRVVVCPRREEVYTQPNEDIDVDWKE